MISMHLGHLMLKEGKMYFYCKETFISSFTANQKEVQNQNRENLIQMMIQMSSESRSRENGLLNPELTSQRNRKKRPKGKMQKQMQKDGQIEPQNR